MKLEVRHQEIRDSLSKLCGDHYILCPTQMSTQHVSATVHIIIPSKHFAPLHQTCWMAELLKVEVVSVVR